MRAVVLAVLMGLLPGWAGAAPAEGKAAPASGPELIMGVFPHLPPRELEDVFGPIAQDLGRHIGRRVVLATKTTFERFSTSLDKGEYDIAFVQPFEYVRIAASGNYLPLATRTERLRGIVVTGKDSVLTDVADLRGKRVALPPASAAVTHLITRHLAQQGLKPEKDVTFSNHQSHVSCMQQVLIGEADACGTAAPSLRFFQKKMNVELKTIVSTRDIPSSLFVAHRRVPEADREKLRDRIVSWSNSPEGKAILARGELTPFMNASDKDYDVVRQLGQ